MRDTCFTFMEPQISHRLAPVPDHFKFNPRGRWEWLQNLAWSYLKKSNCLVQGMTNLETVTYRRIHIPDVVEALFRQKSTVFKLGMNPRKLLIGASDFEDLMGSPRINSLAQFDAQYRVNSLSGYRVMDLEVTIVPWLDGLVVMP